MVDNSREQIRKEVRDIALKAIDDEPEFDNGDMPDEIWQVISKDRHDADIVMRNIVKVTKREITSRFLQALSKE